MHRISLLNWAINFSAAVRDAVSGEVLARLDERFQTWGQAALWAEAQSGMGRRATIQEEGK